MVARIARQTNGRSAHSSGPKTHTGHPSATGAGRRSSFCSTQPVSFQKPAREEGVLSRRHPPFGGEPRLNPAATGEGEPRGKEDVPCGTCFVLLKTSRARKHTQWSCSRVPNPGRGGDIAQRARPVLISRRSRSFQLDGASTLKLMAMTSIDMSFSQETNDRSGRCHHGRWTIRRRLGVLPIMLNVLMKRSFSPRGTRSPDSFFLSADFPPTDPRRTSRRTLSRRAHGLGERSLLQRGP